MPRTGPTVNLLRHDGAQSRQPMSELARTGDASGLSTRRLQVSSARGVPEGRYRSAEPPSSARGDGRPAGTPPVRWARSVRRGRRRPDWRRRAVRSRRSTPHVTEFVRRCSYVAPGPGMLSPPMAWFGSRGRRNPSIWLFGDPHAGPNSHRPRRLALCRYPTNSLVSGSMF